MAFSGLQRACACCVGWESPMPCPGDGGDGLRVAAQCRHSVRAAEGLERAAAVAKSAVACMQDGKREQAVTIVMGVEEMVIHVNTFLNAAALIRRNAEL